MSDADCTTGREPCSVTASCIVLLLSPHGIWDLSFTVCWSLSLLVTLSPKSTKFGTRCLVHRLSEWDKIWPVDRSGLAVHHFQDWWTLAQGVPGRQNSKLARIFCKTFLVPRSAECNEIWYDDGHWSVAGIKWFWCEVWSSFSIAMGGSQIFLKVDIWHTFLRHDEIWNH